MGGPRQNVTPPPRGAPITPDFYDLLYNGYTGEYQLMSSLYRNGLDAVRPPAG